MQNGRRTGLGWTLLAGLGVICLGLTGLRSAAGDDPAASPPSNSSDLYYAKTTMQQELHSSHRTNPADQYRLREGTKINNQVGFFRLDGGKATFVTENGRELGGLPNLNLERVVRVLKGAEDAESIRWHVDGLVTEFVDQNYILISRAVYKSVSQPPLPEQIQ